MEPAQLRDDAAFAAGVALLAAFVVIELRTRVPLLNLRLFANRRQPWAALLTRPSTSRLSRSASSACSTSSSTPYAVPSVRR